MDDVKAQATDSVTLTQRSGSCYNNGWEGNIAEFRNLTDCLAHYSKLAAGRLTNFVN